ncbi:heterocyst frequency control protein PatD [Pseudanabaena sp. FACHB-2040]|uniref:heterocyst frequency control protein PatD n=1 Tax=Pseudanabaena sp. FACHB-2040 TaxID=2692859 RepID=UPI001684F183|nr:heterocyst frequency control protein PatD [Pseudanabaena sp. FACHB-2040]MBD2258744.1 heterocyst frequency control protein PatD [Pseudanabaena sp. FACHB-2040]
MASFSTTVPDFQTQLGCLLSIVSQANPDSLSLQQHFLAVQEQFQGQLKGSEGDLAELAQPILLEMSRTLRLLGMDIAFLQTARQSVTLQQRQKQMCDRIAQLQNFCQGLLKLASEYSPETEG